MQKPHLFLIISCFCLISHSHTILTSSLIHIELTPETINQIRHSVSANKFIWMPSVKLSSKQVKQTNEHFMLEYHQIAHIFQSPPKSATLPNGRHLEAVSNMNHNSTSLFENHSQTILEGNNKKFLGRNLEENDSLVLNSQPRANMVPIINKLGNGRNLTLARKSSSHHIKGNLNIGTQPLSTMACQCIFKETPQESTNTLSSRNLEKEQPSQTHQSHSGNLKKLKALGALAFKIKPSKRSCRSGKARGKTQLSLCKYFYGNNYKKSRKKSKKRSSDKLLEEIIKMAKHKLKKTKRRKRHRNRHRLSHRSSPLMVLRVNK